jgi:hypothetical protein
MNPGRRTEIPNAVMVRLHLAEERDPEVRLRLTLLNLILELPPAITLKSLESLFRTEFCFKEPHNVGA